MDTAPLLLPLLLLVSPLGDDGLGRAPDGRAGFGETMDAGDVLGVFRSPSDEERAWLAEIERLESDVAVLVSNVWGMYLSREYDLLLQTEAEPTLGGLRTAFREALGNLEEELARRDRRAEVLARMVLDTRFQVRNGLLADWEYEARQLAGGLAVLRGAAGGMIVLSENELENVTLRVDLAASFLRALQLDLEALREEAGWPSRSGPSDEDVAELLSLSDLPDAEERAVALAQVKARETDRVLAMREMLFSARLETAAGDAVAWRAQADAVGASRLGDALAILPVSGEDPRDLPLEYREMTATERRKTARVRALEGLGENPLDVELAWVAASMSRLISSNLEAISHYDRFLSLRGIRYDDDRTYRGRELDERESEALVYLQQAGQGESLPGGLPPGAGGEAPGLPGGTG